MTVTINYEVNRGENMPSNISTTVTRSGKSENYFQKKLTKVLVNFLSNTVTEACNGQERSSLRLAISRTQGGFYQALEWKKKV